MVETDSIDIVLCTQTHWMFLSLYLMQSNNSFILFLHFQKIMLSSIAAMQIWACQRLKRASNSSEENNALFFFNFVLYLTFFSSKGGYYEGHSTCRRNSPEKHFWGIHAGAEQNLFTILICHSWSLSRLGNQEQLVLLIQGRKRSEKPKD